MPDDAETPDVWAVTSYRAGETSQILGLTQALGRPWRRVELHYRRSAATLGLLRRVSSSGVMPALDPPWPKLVVSAGLKNEPACRWIRRQSGGRTRLVFLGRTWAPVRCFDLVVTTPQYRLPAAGNVMENPLTLHGVTAQQLAAGRASWEQAFSTLPGRKVGVLVGGGSGPFAFGRDYARQLAAELNELAAREPTTFLVTSSARTPEAFLTTLRRGLEGNHYFHDLAAADGPNPYFGILGWADQLVVTGDSVAMLSEAVATGKPVLLSVPPETGSAGPQAHLYRGAMRWGHQRWTRDVSLVHQRVLADGLACRMGGEVPPVQPMPAGAASGASLDYLRATCQRIEQLFA